MAFFFEIPVYFGYDIWKRKSCNIWGIFFKVLVIVSLLYKLKWYFVFNNYKQLMSLLLENTALSIFILFLLPQRT